MGCFSQLKIFLHTCLSFFNVLMLDLSSIGPLQCKIICHKLCLRPNGNSTLRGESVGCNQGRFPGFKFYCQKCSLFIQNYVKTDHNHSQVGFMALEQLSIEISEISKVPIFGLFELNENMSLFLGILSIFPRFFTATSL